MQLGTGGHQSPTVVQVAFASVWPVSKDWSVLQVTWTSTPMSVAVVFAISLKNGKHWTSAKKPDSYKNEFKALNHITNHVTHTKIHSSFIGMYSNWVMWFNKNRPIGAKCFQIIYLPKTWYQWWSWYKLQYNFWLPIFAQQLSFTLKEPACWSSLADDRR